MSFCLMPYKLPYECIILGGVGVGVDEVGSLACGGGGGGGGGALTLNVFTGAIYCSNEGAFNLNLVKHCHSSINLVTHVPTFINIYIWHFNWQIDTWKLGKASLIWVIISSGNAYWIWCVVYAHYQIIIWSNADLWLIGLLEINISMKFHGDSNTYILENSFETPGDFVLAWIFQLAIVMHFRQKLFSHKFNQIISFLFTQLTRKNILAWRTIRYCMWCTFGNQLKGGLIWCIIHGTEFDSVHSGLGFCEARSASHYHSPQTTYSSKSTCCAISAQNLAMHDVVYAGRLTSQRSIVEIINWWWSYRQISYSVRRDECFWQS